VKVALLFNDLQALTRHLYFDALLTRMTFTFARLELDTDSHAPPRRRAKRR